MFLIWTVPNPHLSQRFTLLQELLQQPAEIKAVKEMKQSNYASDQRKLPSTVCWQWNTFSVGSPWTEDVAGQRLAALPVTHQPLSYHQHLAGVANNYSFVNVYCQATTFDRKLKESNPSEPNPVGQTASAAVSQQQSAGPPSWWVQSTYCPTELSQNNFEDCVGRNNSYECSKAVRYWTLSIDTQMWSDPPDCCRHCCWFELCSSNHLHRPRAFCTGCPRSLSALIIRFKLTQTAVPGFKNDWKVSTGSTGTRHSKRSQKHKY